MSHRRERVTLFAAASQDLKEIQKAEQAAIDAEADRQMKLMMVEVRKEDVEVTTIASA